jgi:gliding motility-associated-like protein
MRFKGLYLFFMVLFAARGVFAQTPGCPVNIGFENGSFNGWVCYKGTLVYNVGDENAPIVSSPDGDRLRLLTNSSPQELDPYGSFPVNSPNGSNHSIRLGNNTTSGNGRTNPAYYERVTYDFIVPNDDYTLICYYAVVLQDFNHPENLQPKLIAKVHNLDDPSDDDKQCGKFYFYASGSLNGFQRSKTDGTVYFKPWSALVMKISNRKGKRFQLDFITHDCSQGAHFGYAYLDFNEANCNSPITGNEYCSGQNTVTLTAPPGFETYRWTDAEGKELSTAPTLKIPSPLPPDGTIYNLQITPYNGLGCANAFTTSIRKRDEIYDLQVVPSMSGCKADGIDLTQASVTAGSSPGMKFEYYTDAEGQEYLSDPKMVTESGNYYIRGTNAYGCTDIKPIHLDLYKGADITIAAHPPICAPATYDLTALPSASSVVTYSYYKDVTLTTPMLLSEAKAISKSGRYYIKAISVGVPCITVETVDLIISERPKDADVAVPYGSCPPLDLNLAIGNVNSGDNTGGVTYTFYTDAAATIVIDNPANIIQSGTYYYKGVNEYGCGGRIGKISVIVYPTPTFKVTDPTPVVYPQTINLADTYIPLTFADFTYWKDAAATKPLDNYRTISESGTYYIKAVNHTGCIIINPVHVLVNAPPESDLIVSNTFTPNGDGINDEFRPVIQGVTTLNYIKIFNRYGKEIFQTRQLYNRWNGTYDGKPEPAGTYYWLFSAYDIFRKKQVMKSGSVTIIR